jgi:dolichyl-diphosphooligosaccharide--protein glycosyltransferase
MINNSLNFHKKLFFKTADTSNNRILISLIALLFLAVIINYGARYYEKTVWDDNPNIFSSEGLPLIRAADPAYFIKQAQYLKKEKFIGDYYNKLMFEYYKKPIDVKPPLFSTIISLLAKDSSLNEIINAGNKFVLLSSMLTSIGIFFLFYVIGRPFEGIIASTAGIISTQYLNRSSIGYIDTDILNLFFIYFLFGLIYLSSKQKNWKKNILIIIVTGLLGKSFLLWYPKPILIILSFSSLVFFTWFNTKDWKRVMLNSLIYILITGPNIYFNTLNIILNNPYLSGYLSANVQSIDLVDKTDLNFNNIFRYIGEQTKLPLFELFEVEGSIYLGIFCFLGLILWAITYPVLFIGLAPLSLFFLTSTIIGVRALIYSSPFIWFGLIYLINFIFFKLSSFKTTQFNRDYIYILTSLSFLAIFLLTNNVFSRTINPPYISSSIVKAMISMNDVVDDKDNSVIVAPWTYGYQSVLYNDIPILIHPGLPTSPRHYFIERANASFDLDETTKILNYVASGEVEKIKEKGIDTFQKLSMDLYSNTSNKDIYLMLTQQQRLWMNHSCSSLLGY